MGLSVETAVVAELFPSIRSHFPGAGVDRTPEAENRIAAAGSFLRGINALVLRFLVCVRIRLFVLRPNRILEISNSLAEAFAEPRELVDAKNKDHDREQNEQLG
jgi:hypothetical protein